LKGKNFEMAVLTRSNRTIVKQLVNKLIEYTQCNAGEYDASYIDEFYRKEKEWNVVYKLVTGDKGNSYDDDTSSVSAISAFIESNDYDISEIKSDYLFLMMIMIAGK
jgi:hypothetical protein